MKLTIDTEKKTLELKNVHGTQTVDLFSPKAFEILSETWVNVGWDQKHVYTFTWMGRPIIQLPEDIVRLQEVIHKLKPDVIIETGVAHGGSLVFYASLCKAMETGRVIGVDIEIRPHNREALESHPLKPYITLFEGNSVDRGIVHRVKDEIKNDETVLVLLDSNHCKAHVLQELEVYGPMVTKGSYIVATDGVMQQLTHVPGGDATWDQDNPIQAVKTFLKSHPEFQLAQPEWEFNESSLEKVITHWPDAWLKKIK